MPWVPDAGASEVRRFFSAVTSCYGCSHCCRRTTDHHGRRGLKSFLKCNENPTRNHSSVFLALILAVALGGIAPNLARADFININPIKDNTLYEYSSCRRRPQQWLGDHFFTGKTGMGITPSRRARVDIAGNVPAGSTITSVTPDPEHVENSLLVLLRTVELHKLLADWGEGTSDASGQEKVREHPATTNDATWRHRFYNTIFWTTQGGDFSGTVSANQSVGDIGAYTWSSAQMTADVQSWLDNPTINFGWLVLGDESAIATAKRFDTRESASPPVLTIRYTASTRVRLRQLRRLQRLRQHLHHQTHRRQLRHSPQVRQ